VGWSAGRAAVWVVVVSGSLGAQDATVSPSSTTRLDFEGFYELAIQKSGRMAESSAQLKGSEARSLLARAPSMPLVQLEALMGPSPNYSGNALQSTTSYDSWGLAFQNKVEIVQPLYAFGALSKLREAARAAHEAELGRHEREKLLLKQDIAKLYYGYQLAFEMREIARDLRDQIRKAREDGEAMRRRKAKGAPSLTDLERLNMFVAELNSRFEEAQKFMDLARMGMAVETGTYPHTEIRWQRANLKRRGGELKELEHYKAASQGQRPEYAALRKEIEAREILAEAESKRSYPMLFAGARWNYALNPASEDQPSVFARDSMNENTFMAGLGLRWNIYSADSRAKAAAARAEVIKTRAKNDALLRSLDAELEKNWTELRFLTFSNEQRELAVQSARRVYLDMLGGFTLGSQPAKDLLEAIGALAMAQKSRLETVFEEHLAWVRLESSVGAGL
jgi:outer membrane protein TolC